VERARGMELRRRTMQQEVVPPGDWRQLTGPSSSGRQFAWRHGMDTNGYGSRPYDTSASYITVPSSEMVSILSVGKASVS
jgi:hypothetical protein